MRIVEYGRIKQFSLVTAGALQAENTVQSTSFHSCDGKCVAKMKCSAQFLCNTDHLFLKGAFLDLIHNFRIQQG